MNKPLIPLAVAFASAFLVASSYAELYSFGSGDNYFEMDFVNIGNAGNAAFVHPYSPLPGNIFGGEIGDTSYSSPEMGYGSVGYNYGIATLEVSIEQFMRAEAACPSGTYIGSGYDEDLWNWQQTLQIDGNSVYLGLGTAAPATAVSFYDAARFVNWMTSTDPRYGVYQFDSNGNYLGTDRQSAIDTYGIAYALPTEDEWFKAAYYSSDTDSYSLYSSGLNTAPSTDGWNLYTNGTHGFQYVWDVSMGTNELNGTRNMMGNVWEWTEMNTNDSQYVLRGGSAYGNETFADSKTYRVVQDDLSLEMENVGFRVVAIPEPNTIGFMAIVGIGILGIRRIFSI